MAIVVGRKSSSATRPKAATPVAVQRDPIDRRTIRRADHTLAPGASVIDLADRRVGRVISVWVPVGASVTVPTSGRAGVGTVIAMRGAAGTVQWSGFNSRTDHRWSDMRAVPGGALPHLAMVRWNGDLLDQQIPVRNLGLLVQSNVQVLQPWEFWQPQADGLVLLPTDGDGRADYGVFADGRTIATARPGAVDPTGLVNLARNRLGAPPLGAPPPKKATGGGGGGLILGGLGAVFLKLLKGKR